MYNGNIKTIQHREQRYETLGDYWTEGGCIQFRISSLGNSDYEFLIALHEMVEKQLARKMGISEQTIDAWDLAHEDAEEPGELEGCPYREAHMIAEGIERAVAAKLGVDWKHYEATCRAIIANTLGPADPTTRDREDTYVAAKDRGGYHPARRTKTKVSKKIKARSILGGH